MVKTKHESKYLAQSPQYPMIMNIRNDESAVRERVYHVSSLFVNLDPVKSPSCSRTPNSVWASREFPHPPELDVEFAGD